jgi:hypothetical protein
MVDRIFSMKRDRPRQRLNYRDLLDGEWWVLDFGDTDVPGVTHKANIASSGAHGPHISALRGMRTLLWRTYGRKLQTRQVPALDQGPYKIRYTVRAVTAEQFYAERA